MKTNAMRLQMVCTVNMILETFWIIQGDKRYIDNLIRYPEIFLKIKWNYINK